MPITIYYEDVEDLKNKLAEAVMDLYYLRKYTENWKEVFGGPAKQKKERWEKWSDEFLERLMKESTIEHSRQKIKIEEKCQPEEDQNQSH